MWKEVGALGEEVGGISGSRNTNSRTGDEAPWKSRRGLGLGMPGESKAQQHELRNPLSTAGALGQY